MLHVPLLNLTILVVESTLLTKHYNLGKLESTRTGIDHHLKQ